MEPSPEDTPEKNQFSIREVRWLLGEIKEENPRMGIKLNLKDQGWQSVFKKIIHTSETHVVLMDEKRNLLKFIPLADIRQFTLDKPFRKMRPHVQFDIRVKPLTQASAV